MAGPLIAGLLVSDRVGAGIGAELGAMRATEQIDALEASAVDPFAYLVVTLLIASGFLSSMRSAAEPSDLTRGL